MLVRVKDDYVPYVGAKGTTKDIPAKEAQVLIVLDKVEAVEQAPVAPPWDDDEQSVDVSLPQPTYQRRDMQAEPVVASAPRRRGRPKRIVPPSDQE